MDASEAREIIKNPVDIRFLGNPLEKILNDSLQYTYAQGYLECLEGSEVALLVNALEVLTKPCTCNPIGPCECDEFVASGVLAQFKESISKGEGK